MSKIRINDLARELEVKSKSILDVLPEVGVTEKKSHSSSLEDHEADKVRARLRAASQAQASSRPPGRLVPTAMRSRPRLTSPIFPSPETLSKRSSVSNRAPRRQMLRQRLQRHRRSLP